MTVAVMSPTLKYTNGGRGSVSDPDPDWIRIQAGPWIRNPDPDPGARK